MVALDGSPLSIADVVAVARDGERVEITSAVHRRMAPSRSLVLEADARDQTMYGVTTGFGALADTPVSPHDRVTLQRALVRSHTAGMGDPLPGEVVRGMMLLRARTLCAGYSGADPMIVDAIAAALNAGLCPWVPEHGSLGASGDLAPLAHAASCLTGEGWALQADGTRVDAGSALSERGLRPLSIGVKDGLALINGTDAMAATLALCVTDLAALLVAADCTAAVSIETLLGTVAAFAEPVIGLRPAAGQRVSAANLRSLLRDSPMVASHRLSHHAVQDAYSLRCTPQVHGAARDVIGFAKHTVVQELASVVDNPVILDGEVISAGNFHGQALAYCADMCAAVCADIAAISERRLDRLMDPARSRGLPAFLSPEPGLNSGLMIAQYTAAAMVVSLRQAATPFAVQSMPTSAGQEDHVSMGWSAALRTRRSVDDLRRCLAIEAVAGAQALDLRLPLRPGPATAAFARSLREHVSRLEQDRVLAGDLEHASAWLRTGGWRVSVEAVAGRLG